jgi:GNAT superfamily N-acetyltransferase
MRESPATILGEDSARRAAEYIADPCGSCSTALWKESRFAMPDGVRVVHRRDVGQDAPVESAQRYFRLIHRLHRPIASALPEGYIFRQAVLPDDCVLIADFLNRCYEGSSLPADAVLEWIKYPVFDAGLWIFIVDALSDEPAALGIADFDADIREGSLEWIQVIPDKRGEGFGAAIVNELLARLKEKADFVTVSGEVDNTTNPERLYRKCGFTGDDVWYVWRD